MLPRPRTAAPTVRIRTDHAHRAPPRVLPDLEPGAAHHEAVDDLPVQAAELLLVLTAVAEEQRRGRATEMTRHCF
eukprot:9491802-Pyramimonas_sp.AAC.3